MIHEHSIRAAALAPELGWVGLALLLPLLSACACALCAALRVKSKAPAIITSLALAGSFVIILTAYFAYTGPVEVPIFQWMSFQWGTQSFQSFTADFALYIDSLTLFWMLFVTGLGTLISIYASEYMESDRGGGYCRFFFGISVFLFSMSALVLGDNLVMLYLGWEGVGLASYLLIGYNYERPSAVAAAKKAFIMNRIGDLGLALGIFMLWANYGTLQYSELFAAMNNGGQSSVDWDLSVIPFLLMLGAFGKSAQIPLFTWLPDAMEGPTPVSALIHAATMVTAGVYLIARLYPFFELHPEALATVAWIGGSTALVAATIGMAQYDIKRVFAYSTISQLGYMFLGLGVGTSFGACYHTLTHAFFKALLFLTAGAIMHGFAGQLDLRKLSGLRQLPGWRIVSWTMFVGCLWLAAFPYTAAFFSKDAILLQALTSERGDFRFLGWLGLFTAALTAYYTFRVWFRVCAGPLHYEGGSEGHHETPAGHETPVASHGTVASSVQPAPASHSAREGHSVFHPHAPRLAINGVLVILAIGALLVGVPAYDHVFAHRENWAQSMIAGSSAYQGAGIEDAHAGHDAHQATILGMDAHTGLTVVGSTASIGGIVIAWFFHLRNRKAADQLRAALMRRYWIGWLPICMENKWYVDEVFHVFFRLPMWVGGQILSFGDRHFLDGVLVDGLAKIPLGLGRLFRPLYGGALQGYAVTMAGGIALVIAWVTWIWVRGFN
ncbi:MAG: NADH-quinone oxidoreductase subunit L [Phycisphaerales bacterium]|nr:NADH-quinone oxidoreductase subunit L [Phycisphaerales bacterium]